MDNDNEDETGMLADFCDADNLLELIEELEQNPSDCLHIMPEDDLREHECTPQCWCNPTPHPENSRIYVHNAMDQRELYEQGKLTKH